MKTPRHAIVIGGGLGGLATSLRLARRGWRVTLCERNAQLGGKMNRWESDGFVFDTGPSVITLPWVFHDLFEDLGHRMEEFLTLHRLETLAQYEFADGTRFKYSADDATWQEEMGRFAPKDRSGYLRFMNLGRRLYSLSLDTFLNRPVFGRVTRKMLTAMRHFPVRYGWRNYAKTVEAHFTSPYLRQLFNRYPTYVGSSPFQSPATFALIPYMERKEGVWHVEGGLYRVVERLAALAQEANIEVRTNTQVACIRNGSGRATGVEFADGTVLASDIVISNGDIANMERLLGSANQAAQPPTQRSLSGFVMLLGVEESLPDWSHHNVLFSADYREEFRQLFEDRRFPDDPTVYVCIPSRSDRRLVPGRGETVFVMANAPARDEPWTETEIRVAKERVMARLVRSGFPRSACNANAQRVLTPTHFSETYASPGGAIYGQDSHGWKRAFLRPPNRNPRVAGLYHVGGSVHPGGGTPTVLMSAKITSDEILRYEYS